LDEESVEVDQVGATLVSGSDNHRDRVVGQDMGVSAWEVDGFRVSELSVVAVDLVKTPRGGVLELGIGWFGLDRDVGECGGVRGLGVVVCDL
jgi:hypothetical protein